SGGLEGAGYVETVRSSRGIIAAAPRRPQPPAVPRPGARIRGTSAEASCLTPCARSGALPRRSSPRSPPEPRPCWGSLFSGTGMRARDDDRIPAAPLHRLKTAACAPSDVPRQDHPMTPSPLARRLALFTSAFLAFAAAAPAALAQTADDRFVLRLSAFNPKASLGFSGNGTVT